METCICCGSSGASGELDRTGRCADCQRIAVKAAVSMSLGDLLYPETPLEMRLDPAYGDGGLCDACGDPLDVKLRAYSSQGQHFFVHDRCWNVIVTL